MSTGEDIQGLRKILDFTRLISLVILSIHFYNCFRSRATGMFSCSRYLATVRRAML
ncbi:MAG: hypothetical protein EOP48_12210 [Sphingobacteriales bacterium]|nr:MAG: hypothetical protein EOP48_12210 [Sphingobacteriales bacterium]